MLVPPEIRVEENGSEWSSHCLSCSFGWNRTIENYMTIMAVAMVKMQVSRAVKGLTLA